MIVVLTYEVVPRLNGLIYVKHLQHKVLRTLPIMRMKQIIFLQTFSEHHKDFNPEDGVSVVRLAESDPTSSQMCKK